MTTFKIYHIRTKTTQIEDFDSVMDFKAKMDKVLSSVNANTSTIEEITPVSWLITYDLGQYYVEEMA